MNRYPIWTYLFIVSIIVVGLLYAAPNLYPPDPSLQITGANSSQTVDEETLQRAARALSEAGIEHIGSDLDAQGRNALIRLRSHEQQLPGQARLQRTLGDGYIVALNLAPTTPPWLSRIGAKPMKLGLDLSGGIHFKLEVDVDAALENRRGYYQTSIQRLLREEQLRGSVASADGGQILARFGSEDERNQARKLVTDRHPELDLEGRSETGSWLLSASLSEAMRGEIAEYAVSQNLTTLRNRVNELGVSEPLVQRQGRSRIVVELPGIQDAAEAKRILGTVANLEFRLVANLNAPESEKQRFEYRDEDRAGLSEWLERDVIITGERVANATASFDENGRPNVQISLDGEGGTLMSRITRENVKRRMGVLFIERKYLTRYEMQADGTEIPVQIPRDERKLLTAPVIQSAFGAQFQITGLDNPLEASELALMLRAGALAAPISFVEERTVGPSLGAENIRLGMNSVQYGMATVVLFMLAYYRVFGAFAVVALSANIVLLIAVMSLIGATLTLPGIAGIVLTVGMAVDANVLIFERIREELRQGRGPHTAIRQGYDHALSTIWDANITTLIVGLILYAIGTGPVKGFAVTLSVGILTSMFTAIVGTRALANLVYGRRKVKSLSIGSSFQISPGSVRLME